MRSMQSKRRVLGTSLAVGTLVLGLVACGEDSKDDSGTEPAAGSTDRRGGGPPAAGDPLKLGVLNIEGVPGSDHPEVRYAVEAAADALNDNGGVAGRPVEIAYCNYKFDPNELTRCTRQLIDDGVVAVVGSLIIGSLEPYTLFQEAGIPMIGTNVSNEGDWSNPISFPLDGGTPASVALGSVAVLKELQDIDSYASVIYQIPVTEQFADFAAKNAECLGIDYAGTVNVPIDATDYSPYATQLEEMDAGGAGFPATPAQIAGTVVAAYQLGVPTKFALPDQSLDSATLEQLAPVADDLVGVMSFPPVSAADDFPAVQHFLDDMQASSVEEEYQGPLAFRAWLSVQALAAVTKGMAGDDLTSESLLKTLNSATDVDVDGLFSWSPSATGPVAEFPRLSNMDVYAVQIEDGQPVLAMDDPISSYAC